MRHSVVAIDLETNNHWFWCLLTTSVLVSGLAGCGGAETGGNATSVFSVTALAGTGGTITPTSQQVEKDKSVQFTLIPADGHRIGSVTGCNGSLTGTTYTTGAIFEACEVKASFTLNSYNLSTTAGEGGSVSPTTATVNYGSTHSFTITPQAGYTIASVIGCGGSLVGGTYTTAAIMAPCSISASFTFASVGGINDTGVERCANTNTNNLNCPVVGFEGQDGEFGRDAKALAGTLTKIGGGVAGFDYSKIAADGSVLAIQNVAWDSNGSEAAGSQWSCVRDNLTGLIWEVKTAEVGLRDMNNTYSWYNPDINTNGGIAGMQNGGICTGSVCDTNAFVQAVNSQSLCGAKDWRLPTRLELMGIANNGRDYPAIDTAYFPNTKSIRFWTSSPMANDASYAWTGHFSIGGFAGLRKIEGGQIRLVRVAK